MSRCCCCNNILTDYEMSLKGKVSGEYLGMSLECIKETGIPYTGNPSLKKISKTEELEENNYKPVNLKRPIWEAHEYEDD